MKREGHNSRIPHFHSLNGDQAYGFTFYNTIRSRFKVNYAIDGYHTGFTKLANYGHCIVESRRSIMTLLAG